MKKIRVARALEHLPIVEAAMAEGRLSYAKARAMTRTIPPGIRRALQARDRGCRFPGCTFKRYVDGHHVRHWADGGEAKISNLVTTLRRFHHRLVHEGRVTISAFDDGAYRFIQPGGQAFESPAPPRTDWRELVATHGAAGIQVTRQTAGTAWTGEALDLDEAVGWLMQKANWAKHVAAEAHPE